MMGHAVDVEIAILLRSDLSSALDVMQRHTHTDTCILSGRDYSNVTIFPVPPLDVLLLLLLYIIQQ